MRRISLSSRVSAPFTTTAHGDKPSIKRRTFQNSSLISNTELEEILKSFSTNWTLWQAPTHRDRKQVCGSGWWRQRLVAGEQTCAPIAVWNPKTCTDICNPKIRVRLRWASWLNPDLITYRNRVCEVWMAWRCGPTHHA